MRAGAEGEGEVTPIEEGGAVVPIRTPTIIIHKIKAKIHRQMPDQSLIRKAPNIKTYQPVQAGPVPSTGRRDGVLHTVVTPWCVNGTRSSPLAPTLPEKSANLDIIKIKIYF